MLAYEISQAHTRSVESGFVWSFWFWFVVAYSIITYIIIGCVASGMLDALDVNAESHRDMTKDEIQSHREADRIGNFLLWPAMVPYYAARHLGRQMKIRGIHDRR